MKKIFSLLISISLIMVLLIVPTKASEGVDTFQIIREGEEIATYSEKGDWIKYIQDGDTLKLLNDTTGIINLCWNIGKGVESLTIDLNGHSINSTGHGILVNGLGNSNISDLTIKNSNTSVNSTISAKSYGICFGKKTKLNMEGNIQIKADSSQIGFLSTGINNFLTVNSPQEYSVDSEGHTILDGNQKMYIGSIQQSDESLNNRIIYLDKDVSELLVYHTMKVDLNGHTIKGIIIGHENTTKGDLTLMDSSGKGKVIEGSNAEGVAIFLMNGNLTVNGGTITGTNYAISGNGSFNQGTTLVINGGLISSTADKSAAIYNPQLGKVEINGGEINGSVGIQMCSGELVINGGTINATGTDERNTKSGDGVIPDGAAISIVNRPGYSSVPNATISGGTFKSANSEGLLAYTWSKDTASEWTDVKGRIQVKGGTFDSDPTDYVKDGYKAYPVEDTFKVAPIATGIQLSDETLTLEAGSDKTLTAVVNPNETLDTVTWQSSDSKVATVENGVVTAVAPGTATITATAGSAKAECTVSVYKVENPTPPSVDTEKPVEKPQAGLNDEKAPGILNETLKDIISKGENSQYTDMETANKINSAIASGETITVAPTVEEIDTGNTQASDDIKAIEKELKQMTQENNSVTEVAMYLDLSVLVKTSTSTLGNITVLPKPITFTVVLPNDVAENAKDKDVYVLRIHEGKVEKIKASLVDHVITFETDRFSTYAVVFEEKTVTPTPTPEENTHQVIFVDMNGAVLKVETVKDGEKATAPTAPAIEGYTFTKWDTDFSKVTKDLVVTAVYEKLPAEEVVKPDDKGENKTENTDNPSTGDKTNASLYSAFALLGLVSAALVVVEKKRRSLSR